MKDVTEGYVIPPASTQVQPNSKLVVITRNDIPDGYQLVQSNHAVADFAYEHPQKFKEWKDTSNYIISLQIPDEHQLIKLYEKLSDQGAIATLFREPDIDNEATSFAFFGTEDLRKKVSNLKLSLKK